MSRARTLFLSLAFTLGASLWLTLYAPDEQGTVVEAVKAPPGRAAVQRPARTTPAGIDTRAPSSVEWRTAPWPQASAEALAAWSPPPPPAPARAVAAPAAPPRPPAFPYQWIGRLDDGDAAQALLSGPTRSFGVRAGEVLDSNWRVDSVAAAGLQVTWLPTGGVVHVAAR